MNYPLAQAVQDLQQEGWLQGVLLSRDGVLCEADNPHDIDFASGDSFAGAALDSRRLPSGALFVALAGEQVDGRDYVAAAVAAGHWVLTRRVDGDDPLVGQTCPAAAGVLLSDDPEKALACLAAHWRRRLNIKVVAITGTNGKTTCKDLVRSLLSGAGKTQATAGNFNNHLGLPLTLLNLENDTRYAVIEMGASAVGEIRFLAGLAQPDVGVITNASPAHLAEFGSLENIIEGKGELLEVLPAGGTAILNADSPGFAQWEKRSRCRVISWGETRGDHRWGWSAQKDGFGVLTLDGDHWPVPLPGQHNAANLCAAILACRSLGLADKNLKKGLESFEGSAHRGLVFTWQGRQVLDDSYNANPVSMQAAAASLEAVPGTGRAVAVLGFMAELGCDSEKLHHETGVKLRQTGVQVLVAVGPGAEPLAAGFGTGAEAVSLASHAEAFAWLQANTQAGDRILLKGSRSSAMETIARLMQDDNQSETKETQ